MLLRERDCRAPTPALARRRYEREPTGTEPSLNGPAMRGIHWVTFCLPTVVVAASSDRVTPRLASEPRTAAKRRSARDIRVGTATEVCAPRR